LEAERQERSAVPVGKESEVTDADESGRQKVEQEAAQELIDSQSHEPFLVAVGGVTPAEGDVARGESDQSAVGDCDTMGVRAEIAQHVFRTTEWALGVNNPVVAEEHPQPGSEGARLSQGQQAVVELQLPSMKSVAEAGDELTSEHTAKHADGKKEGAAC
jgi:hypothetical protein